MKKLFTLVLTVILVFSVVTVNAQLPAALSGIYTNYTGNYSFSVSFESSEDIVALLDEIEIGEEINNFIDIKALLKSLFTLDTDMKLQADISENFDKAELAITSSSRQSVEVSQNLNIDINAKDGIWIKLDLSSEEPVFEIVYSGPFVNKYMKMDLFEMITDEAEKEEFVNSLKSVYNKEYIVSTQDFAMSLLEKYADIKTSGANCTIKLDNEGLTSIIDEIMDYTAEKIADTTGEAVEYPSFKGMQFLGDDGITVKYSFAGGKISGEVMDADISINLSEIYTQLYGMEWMYNSEGIFDLKVKSKGEMSNISKTKVAFPQLTDENSFDFMDMMETEEDYYYEYEEDYVYEPAYPYYYAYGSAEYLPVIDGEIYVPIRETFVSAYDDTVDIGYNNGVITLTSDYFPGFSTLTLAVDSDVAYADGQAYYTDKILKIGNTTYASSEMFEDIFGWTLEWASYDMLGLVYDYGFWTESYYAENY